jgi:hypothetical protein
LLPKRTTNEYRIIHKDINSYLVPGDIDRVLSILLGIGAEPGT